MPPLVPLELSDHDGRSVEELLRDMHTELTGGFQIHRQPHLSRCRIWDVLDASTGKDPVRLLSGLAPDIPSTFKGEAE